MLGAKVTSTWLSQILIRAEHEKLCVKRVCTTCGSMEFRKLLMMAMVREFPELRVAGVQFGALHAHCLLRSLAEIDTINDAVPLLLVLCWDSLGETVALREMPQQLRGTPAGRLLERMIAHEQCRSASRAEHEERNDPELVRLNREKKKLERHRQHEERKKHFRELWLTRNAAKPSGTGPEDAAD